MKTMKWWIPAALFVHASFASGANFGNADFTLRNYTGRTIEAVHVEPYFNPNNNTDRLGINVLQSGQSLNVRLPDASFCNQRLHVTFSGIDREATWEQLDLCALNQVTLSYDNETGYLVAHKE